MFWVFRLREQIKQRFTEKITTGEPLIIRDEKTMSGRVHVGSLRGVVIHGLIAEVLSDAGIRSKFLFEINDYDLMDSLPVYIDQERYRPYLGRLLYDVPAPEGDAPNFAEHWAQEFIKVIEYVGFYPEYYRSSEMYKAGKYNEAITLALDHADAIRSIYRNVSGSRKDTDWFPLQVICESCGKVGTTNVVQWDGRKVRYMCMRDYVAWAQGCGYEGSVEPFDGRAKLPWKVEWPAKFMVFNVDIEGAGKDHSTKGGPRDIARAILKEVFHYPEPFDIPYNFFVVAGQKMSSSKGKGSSAKEITELLPPHMVRFLLMKEPAKEIDFEPYGDTIPALYDSYDTIASSYFSEKAAEWREVFPYAHLPHERKKLSPRFLPRFSQVAYLAQMPHISIEQKVADMKGGRLTRADTHELKERVTYAQHWLTHFSPEKYQFKLQEQVPAKAAHFSEEQRTALREILDYIRAHEQLKGDELHAFIHEVKKKHRMKPATLFQPIYVSFLGKESGPQAGWFLSALNREFVIKRFQDVTS